LEKKKCAVKKYTECHDVQTSAYCFAQKCCKYIKKVDQPVKVVSCLVGKETCSVQKCACPHKRCECPSKVSYVCAGGKTYQNECVAKCAGASNIILGKCAKVCPPTSN